MVKWRNLAQTFPGSICLSNAVLLKWQISWDVILVFLYTWTKWIVCWIYFTNYGRICCIIRAWCIVLCMIDQVRAIHLQRHLRDDWDWLLILNVPSRGEVLIPWNSHALHIIRVIGHRNSHSFCYCLLLVVCDVSTLTLSIFVSRWGGWVC